MIKKIECEMIICDNCKDNFEDYNGFSIFSDSSYCNPEDYDWHVDDNNHYCPDCHSIDGNNNIFVKPERFKP